MKRKIISIGIVSCFLLATLFSMSTVGIKLNVSNDDQDFVNSGVKELVLIPVALSIPIDIDGFYIPPDEPDDGADFYCAAINDPVDQPDDDRTYIYTDCKNNRGKEDTSFIDFIIPYPSGVYPDFNKSIDKYIYSLEVFIRVKISGSYRISPHVYWGGVNNGGWHKQEVSGYETFSYSWDFDPVTKKKWSWDFLTPFNMPEIGVTFKHVKGSDYAEQRCTQIYAIIRCGSEKSRDVSVSQRLEVHNPILSSFMKQYNNLDKWSERFELKNAKDIYATFIEKSVTKFPLLLDLLNLNLG